MDDFGLDRPELTGALMSFEFGPGGRIHQIWITSPITAAEPDEHPFVLSPLTLADDFTEDYLPGAILIGARTQPDDPWILSRNTEARVTSDGEDPTSTAFEYEFSLLPEILARGSFYERSGAVPHVVWELTITNRSKAVIEIGELGLPFALNNYYGGFADKRTLGETRMALHLSLSGAASYIHAQRLNCEPPGLIIAPGDETIWESYASVPSTLRSADDWPGIPVIYIYSKGTFEREGWTEWFNGSSSLIMEPGDSRTFKTLFIPTDSGQGDGALAALAALEQPAIGVYPAAIAPADVGILVQISGATPTQVYSDAEAELEPESEEGRGSCHVAPKGPGPVRFSFEDTRGRRSYAQLLFTEPIETLIRRRGQWIVHHQVVREGPMEGAIAMADLESGSAIVEIEDYQTPFGIESSLSDALFLAEKNSIYPETREIEVLHKYLRFVRTRIQNPATFEVGCLLEDLDAAAYSFGPHRATWLLGRLLVSMAQVERDAGNLKAADDLDDWARKTLSANRRVLRDRSIDSLSSGLKGMAEAAGRWSGALEDRLPSYSESRTDFGQSGPKRFLRRGLAPCWWWYGSDRTTIVDPAYHNRTALDKGELCLGPSSVEDSSPALGLLKVSHAALSPGALRLSLGGLMSVWGLVRPDGGAASSFCPDPASEQFGMSPVTGTVGLALYHYLTLAASYYDPSEDLIFGCHVSHEIDWIKVTPWDGVGRRIVILGYRVEVAAAGAVIREFRVRRNRLAAVIRLENTASFARTARLRIRGLWGDAAKVNGAVAHAEDGWLNVEVSCEAGGVGVAEIRMQS